MTLIEPSSEHVTVRTLPETMCDDLDVAIIRAVTYSDIFDYPLTSSEIHRYLVDIAASVNVIDERLTHGRLVPRYVSSSDGHFTLPGREHIVGVRRERQQNADLLWPRALHYGRIIASLPFVKMVAVTGELAMDNTRDDSDIDYFIVTEPERLWLCRLMVIAVVRFAAPRGDIVCPNFLLSERALVLDDRNLYTAHEVTQMVPIYGIGTYQHLRELNPWVEEFLPNAGVAPRDVEARPRARRVRALLERLLRTRAGAMLEKREMERKVRKFTREGIPSSESSFSAEWCKGHVDGHGERVLTLFGKRWSEVEGQLR